MSWNYRVFVHRVDGEDEYTIREAYYDDPNDDQRITSWTLEPAVPHGETTQELRQDLSCMMLAFHKPVYDPHDENMKRWLTQINERESDESPSKG